MAHEFFLQSTSLDWYLDHAADVRSAFKRLPTFAKETSDREFWLKAKDSPGAWDYDLRVFLDPQRVLVEVTTFSSAYFADLRCLIASLSRESNVRLVDEDGEVVRWD